MSIHRSIRKARADHAQTLEPAQSSIVRDRIEPHSGLAEEKLPISLSGDNEQDVGIPYVLIDGRFRTVTRGDLAQTVCAASALRKRRDDGCSKADPALDNSLMNPRSLTWLCVFCGQLRVFEGGRPLGSQYLEWCPICGSPIASRNADDAAMLATMIDLHLL